MRGAGAEGWVLRSGGALSGDVIVHKPNECKSRETRDRRDEMLCVC